MNIKNNFGKIYKKLASLSWHEEITETSQDVSDVPISKEDKENK